MKIDQDFKMTIGGKQMAAPRSIPVVNPSTGERFADAPDCTPAQLDMAVAAAAEAFKTWRSTRLEERQGALSAAADALSAHREDLARLFTREHGRPIEGAKFEIDGASHWLRQFATMAPPTHSVEDDTTRVETRYVPLGVVCAIAPWNFPISLATWKIAPALLTGNTMVLKPSPFTPLCTLKIGELLAAILPPGVLNVVSGGDELGPMMTRHPGFAKISFTGSTETGKLVMASAARDLKRVTLELGGNDAAIVLPDVDVEDVANKLFFNAFINTAQLCVATKRLYVHEDIYGDLRDRLAELARAATLGDGAEQGVMFGPIQNKRQYERVLVMIEKARARGLKLIQGPAGPTGAGYFVPITIVDDPPEDDAVVREEAFGPILPMLKFRDIDDVIRRANDTVYGLGGSVWSTNIELATRIAERLETGTVWINQNINLRTDTPFAGHKSSGIGVENGLDGLLEYLSPQSIYVAKT